MNFRVERLNTDIMRVLTTALQKSGDPALAGVTITRVEVSGDQSEAKIFVDGGIPALEKAGGMLRNELAQNIKMKQTPHLRFVLDKGVKNAARVEELLAQIGSSSKKG